MICERPECGHPDKIHNDSGCRKTSCKCDAFLLPEPATAQIPGGRRICMDVPDGYMLTVSLVPYTETNPEPEK